MVAGCFCCPPVPAILHPHWSFYCPKRIGFLRVTSWIVQPWVQVTIPSLVRGYISSPPLIFSKFKNRKIVLKDRKACSLHEKIAKPSLWYVCGTNNVNRQSSSRRERSRVWARCRSYPSSSSPPTKDYHENKSVHRIYVLPSLCWQRSSCSSSP